MPELPEVEVTRRGIAPFLEGQTIDAVSLRTASLRWPIPPDLPQRLAGTLVKTVTRRGKFILIECEGKGATGTLLIHLGMTGSLRIHAREVSPQKHDHVDIHVGPQLLRFHDPRRFGAFIWHDASDPTPVLESRHLRGLGVEPLSAAFAGERGGRVLYEGTRGRTAAIKQILLSGQIVVGVGNIYASESLFHAGIDPRTPAGRISRARCQALAEAVRRVLKAAIAKGGSTLRDFVRSDGASGYFQLEYFVYDRAGEACRVCGNPVRALRQGQRSSFYCRECQRR